MAAREDFRQRLTNALIESIEENDGLPWEKGWDNMATRPFNPGTGIKYRGGNVINLMLEQIRRGSDDPRWMTLKQANSAGYSVRKGAKASYVEYWDWGQPQAPRKAEVDEKGNPLPRNDADEDAEEEETQRRKPRVFFATVFNGDDIVGLPEIKREISWQPNDLAEKLIAATGAEIEHAAVSRVGFGVIENAAYYTHGRDKIVVPPRESFKSEGDYYATVLHELSHWTGHHSRLARRAPDEKRPFGSPEYAQEELRAEIASMFLTSMLGVEGKIHNHAKYTGHWLETLKGDKHEIFRAARDAEKIVDHVFEYAPELREIVESRMADNLLPKEPPKRKFDSGISPDMPNFIPPEVQAQVRTGRDDPRWAAFDQTVRGEARKFGVEDAVVDKALGLIEPQFTEVMDAAKRNGYTADDMNTMLARSIIDEMRTADVRQQQWERFCEQVRKAGADLYPVEQIEVALQELGGRYQQLIAQSTQEGWTKPQTETQIRAMIYGDEGRRPITGEYVKTLVENSAAARQLDGKPTASINAQYMDLMITVQDAWGTIHGCSDQKLKERWKELLHECGDFADKSPVMSTELNARIYRALDDGRSYFVGNLRLSDSLRSRYERVLREHAPLAAHGNEAGVENDDDFVLTPLGLSDAMPEDSGAVADEHIKGAERYIMDDAEVQMSAP